MSIKPTVATAKPDGRLLRGAATRERVLDAAERLFATVGFDGVSIRQIAQEAGVTLGVVGFHSGSKLELFKTVLRRRVAPLSAARTEALAEIRKNPARRTDVAALVDAYLAPQIEISLSRDPQWRAYSKLVGQIVHDERWYDLLHELYDADAAEYLAALAEALPATGRERLAAAFFLTIAVVQSTAVSRARAHALSKGGGSRSRGGLSNQDMTETLLDFCIGGMERTARTRS
jgi:AcrR family transcriptional regulator